MQTTAETSTDLRPPTAAELERLMAAYLNALAQMRAARADLREGLERHQATASLSLATTR